MSVKKKRLLSMAGLVLALAVVCVLYFLVPKGKSKDTDTNTDDTKEQKTISVETIDKDTVNQISINMESETIELVKEKDTWKFKGDSKTPVKTETVDTMLTNLSPVKAEKELAMDQSNLSEYGLDHPAMTVNISTNDGKQYQYSFGSEVPVVGGYYGLNSEGKQLYALSSELYTAFHQTKNTMIEMETAPEITSKHISYLSVENESGKVFETKEVSEGERVDATSKWNVTKPYKIPQAANASSFTTLLDTYCTYAFSSCEGYGVANDKKYGFDQPTGTITMKYYTAKESAQATPTPTASTQTDSDEIAEKDREYHDFKLVIGKKTSDGYYVTMEGFDGVYVMAKDTIKTLLKPDVYTYIDHCVYANLATSLKGFDVTVGSKKIHVVRKATGEKKDGVEQNEWYLNGEKVDTSKEDAEQSFLTPYSKAYLLEYTGMIKSSVQPKSDKEVMKIVYHEESKDVTVKFLPYDGENFYRIEKNGESLFLVDKRSVDDAATAFTKMLDSGK